MVYVNSKKFACESCIKGHRSSSCHHTDRPLFEIKKKGRPVSQCTTCRELRQSKKFHSKCTCNHRLEEAQAVQPLASSSSSKTRRFIPIVPALPNGLKDVLTASQTPMLPSDSRQRVDSLLNPCDCKSLWKCKCKASKNTAIAGSSSSTSDAAGGLDTLARAAVAMSCCTPSSSSSSSSSSDPTEVPSSQPASSPKHSHLPRTRSRPGSSPGQTQYPSSKRRKHIPLSKSPGPALAPLLYISSSTSSVIAPPMPDFPMMPPMSEITSLAGSGCTCGVKCACPGCVEHRGSAHANRERADCTHGQCGTCIDSSIGIALPNLNGGPDSSTSVSFLDQFFARAAALPPPPMHRKTSSYLDPMDTTIYSAAGSQSFVFGNVDLPKLECCGGQCRCPVGQCSCQNSCAGDSVSDGQFNEGCRESMPREIPVAQTVRKSCCA